ncbi:cysteine synthase family protein [Bacillus sp. RG28]|uniref:Cysteine synthase family protein n=1 Tax=Gottfriedia endophytica TaxID=2820819 RepID=A0A940NKM6_9BACI|nr:cysteine synthase family protein [Gottfriedia endophytica]MBP0724266.1 cysteine synthase family protein [Gottfriedia endophytica]
MKVVKSVHELIGNTPLIEITSYPLPKGTRLFAKLEFFNPGGSVKDRLGMELIEDAFEKGLLKEGGTVIEPTAGNTGIGLAIAANRRNVNVMFVVPEKFSQEKQALMRALGATVVNTPTSEGMTGAIEKAKKLVEEIPNSYLPLQFQNPANPSTYYKTLGPELVEQLNGKIDVFVAGAGSGGTFAGTAQYLKDHLPEVKTVIVEPEGSILNGGKPGPHDTEGIGMEFIPSFLYQSLMDKIYTVSDDNAFMCVRELALKEGLLVGSSSGAAFYASLKEAENAKPGSTIVTIFPDSSDRYLSKNIYGER